MMTAKCRRSITLVCHVPDITETVTEIGMTVTKILLAFVCTSYIISALYAMLVLVTLHVSRARFFEMIKRFRKSDTCILLRINPPILIQGLARRQSPASVNGALHVFRSRKSGILIEAKPYPWTAV